MLNAKLVKNSKSEPKKFSRLCTFKTGFNSRTGLWIRLLLKLSLLRSKTRPLCATLAICFPTAWRMGGNSWKSSRLPLYRRPFNWARTFKCLWGLGIDSKEWIPPAYVACRAGNPILPRFLAPIDFLKIPALTQLSSAISLDMDSTLKRYSRNFFKKLIFPLSAIFHQKQ